MDLSSEPIKKVLLKYKFRDLAIEELQKLQKVHNGMMPNVDTYTFTDSSQKDLLKLVGNIPVRYQGRSYNLPILIWLLDSFPFTPPICQLRPTPNMVIREGRHVDARGRIYLPALHNWDHPKSSVNSLIKEMIAKFEEDPPLASKPSPSTEDPTELLAFVSNLKITEGGGKLERQVNKVTVVGGGDLGMASVLSILAKSKDSIDKLVLVDLSEASAKGGTMDLEMFHLPNLEVSKDLASSVGSKIVVMTANAWSNEQSYVSVVQTNVDLYRGIIPSLARLSPNAVMLIASQPVDIMTYVAWKQSGLPPSRVIGAGCNLDSERLNYILNVELMAQSIGKLAFVIGELSDNKVAVWTPMVPVPNSHSALVTSDATKPLIDRAFDKLKEKGQRSWSVGLSIADVTHSILEDKGKIHSVSTLAQGWCGIGAEVFLSLPCALGGTGSARLAGVALGPEEDTKLRESAMTLSNFLLQLRI
ncbi:ubiquitin-conjugating enzyme E2 variant 3 isoform X1 [Paramormyrops kingsleyae]|uniref:UEV and lactate/malate dehyrogenase domains n=2 Tax=Paramormyrops kingsleyae TaxID=1676925 RepID=A0A3B3R614_9TELE|nr:ubiquitin-conjugating enzyme E2 variant 3-like isoform X2 [Paramormyrops kingsleyae]